MPVSVREPRPPVTWDVIGIGENSVDEIYRLPAAPAAGSKLPIVSRRRLAGGQVATAICTCAALGLRAKYVGVFGSDANGALVRSELARRGVDVRAAPVRDVPNRYAVILVDGRTGDRTVLWARDPELSLRPEELTEATIAGARLVHVDATDEEAAIRAALIARSRGALVTTDIDQVTGRTADLVAAATTAIVAEQVPQALTGQRDPGRALRAMQRLTAAAICVTRGPSGAMLLQDDVLYECPAFPVDVVDTTGAGDVFRGAFIYALLGGRSPADVLRFATAAAAVSCTREGAIGGVPTLAEVEALVDPRSGPR
ncbi:MAG TPA: PfkB family carbohydrate kinase [Vicinamibacterales bacterium]|nr:PfkB family carbohydrate kinase [Vicinamibacterales bacterium]